MRNIGVILLAGWTGAAIYFSAVVAPTAFSVLRGAQVVNATEIAGSIVNRSLSIINTSGFVITILLIVVTLLRRHEISRTLLLVQLGALGCVALATGVGKWIIAARMHAIRAAISVPVDHLPLEDTRRMDFATLHRYSVLALAVAMIAALIASYLLARNAQTN
jgi:hypothetical protein